MNLDKVIKIRISGRNVGNYIKRIIKRNIKFVEIELVSKNEVFVVLRYDNYLELVKYRSILYKIEVVDKLGILKVKEKFSNNKLFVFLLVFGFSVVIFLSNIIFSVEVIHYDKNIRDLVYDELERYGIRKYSFKKNYSELESIEDKILLDNKDRLEWLEIDVDGTFVVVRVQERIINKDNKINNYQSIVSKKNAVIRKIVANSGEIIKEEGVYVKKGDTVISGYITRPDNSSSMTIAIGKVYGEVWYEVDIFYPFVYQESNLTGRSNSGITIKFFNKEYRMFGRNSYRIFSRKNKVLVKDNFLGVEVIWEKRYEVDNRDEVYTEELVENRAVSYIKDKLLGDNLDIREVLDVKVLDRNIDYDGVKFKFFVTTLEDIGEVLEISEENDKETIR